MPTTRLQFAPDASSAIRTQPQFSRLAPSLLKQFRATFSRPLEVHSQRFCWDYWNVPGQYRLLRTPAESFFGDQGHALIRALTEYGRTHLGCQMISHPWMSVYLDGHYQNLHSDVPHGPFSFVYSLTPYSEREWKTRPFRGGETLVAKPKLIRYFRELKSDQSDETEQLFYKIPQPFNQLTVFDPRYPHGVERVEGVDDLLKARVVIHGWFTEPRPTILGPLTESKARQGLDLIADHLMRVLGNSQYTGLLTLKLHVNPSGTLTKTQVLCAHLTSPMGDVLSPSLMTQIYQPILEQSRSLFPKARASSTLTLPIEFRA
jgi:hypothetical protein